MHNILSGKIFGLSIVNLGLVRATIFLSGLHMSHKQYASSSVINSIDLTFARFFGRGGGSVGLN